MEDQICATKHGLNYTMCEHCSSIKFNKDGSPYWMCNKYNVKLQDSENRLLLKCKPCIENN